ncbi:DNA cytosine methyltransferase [Corallococcus terminator]
MRNNKKAESGRSSQRTARSNHARVGPDALNAVSLFSNCGAGDVGFAQAGFRFRVMAELDPRRLEIALRNHIGAVGVPGDLRSTWRKVVSAYRDVVGSTPPALLAACPPCQGMSSARSGRGSWDDADAGSRDARNLLVVVVAKVANALKPRVVVVENVEAFLSRKVRHPRTGRSVSAATLLVTLLAREYEVFPLLANLADFGVAQNRKRAFLTFLRRDEGGLRGLLESGWAPYPRPSYAADSKGLPHITVAEALQELRLGALDASSQETAGTGLHSVPIWGRDHRYAMVSAIPPGSGGSAWQNNSCGACAETVTDEDAAECSNCKVPLLRPVVRGRGGRYRLVRGFRTTSYRRMSPDAPASTITTASGHVGSDITLHPYENRVLSMAECAHLQTFPESFDWGDALDRWGSSNVRAMIGEAVPPRFTHAHGQAIVGVLTGTWTVGPLGIYDPRFQSALGKLGLRGLYTRA